MSGQIFQPNLTDPGRAGHIQRNWQLSASSCNLPAADFDLPIICVGYGPSDPQNRTFHEENIFRQYHDFSACCSDEPWNNTVNVYTVARHFQTPVCFTANEEVAKGWDECVKKATVGVFEKWKAEGVELNNATRVEDAFGRCEYINYAAFEEGPYNKW